MHEGVVSTRLGLKGIPALAEEVMVARDLQITGIYGRQIAFYFTFYGGAIEQVRAS